MKKSAHPPASPTHGAAGPSHNADAAGGVWLVVATVAALAIANSPLGKFYDHGLHVEAGLFVGSLVFQQSLLHWINDGLMAIFFLSVGLEIKHEVLAGQLKSPAAAALPIAGAIGGMIIPAAIYLLANSATPENLAGWAIPSATDIGFAVGILALIGRGLPPGLRTFLVALAIIDDLGAIIIIALFYTSSLSATALSLAAIILAMLVGLNQRGEKRLAPYLVLGVALWACVLQSGVHATLSGVALAMVIPINPAKASGPSPLRVLEHALKPWITYLVLPLFAFANAGLNVQGLALADLTAPLPLGIMMGLFLGKPVGVLGAAAIAAWSGLATWPKGASILNMAGIGCLCGIGFTMSLFIGSLAFNCADDQAFVRLGVLVGSALSVLAGTGLLAVAKRQKAALPQA
jgi:NhaA family Na+:H+ antiporter